MAVNAPVPADQLRRRVAAPVGLAAAAGSLAAGLLVLGPARVVPFRCPFLALTGLDCPFCGGTRGASELVRGHLQAALDLNAFSTVLLLAVAFGWVVWLVSRARGRVLTWVPGNRAWLTFAFVAVTFWVLRDLPGPTSVLAA